MSLRLRKKLAPTPQKDFGYFYLKLLIPIKIIHMFARQTLKSLGKMYTLKVTEKKPCIKMKEGNTLFSP